MKLSFKKILMILVFGLMAIGCMDQNTAMTMADSSFHSVEGAPVNPLRAAQILGLAQNPAATGGNCTKCHGNFKSGIGLANLSLSTVNAYQCVKKENMNDSDKIDALACLAKLSPALSQEEAIAIEKHDANAIAKALTRLGSSNLGFLAAGTNFEAFKNLFTGNDNRFASLYNEPWVKNLAMPKGVSTLTESDFFTALNWFIKGAPDKENFLIHNATGDCSKAEETFIGSAVREHVKRMSQEGEGWNFQNMANKVKMFACSESGTCFQGKINGHDVFPKVDQILSVAGEVRQLYTLPPHEKSNFWTRSSADGQYVSYGSFPMSVIVDLKPLLENKPARRIEIDAEYDPAFTPDNRAFIIQGEKNGSRFCNQNMLAGTNLKKIDFRDSNCTSTNFDIGLYQGIGKSLGDNGNGDIMTIAGDYISDDGTNMVQDTPRVFFEDSYADITRIVQTETGFFKTGAQKHIITPYIGSWVLSPSQELAIGTVSAANAYHGGYAIYMTNSLEKLGALPSGPNDPNGSVPARLCVGSGEKPQFSFDERFLVYYAYEKHGNPVLSQESSANLYVIDLLGDGKPVQLTNLPKGFYAQFPHFRSDGWLYFDILNANVHAEDQFGYRIGERRVVATNAILLLQK